LQRGIAFGLLIGGLAGLRNQRGAKRAVASVGLKWVELILDSSGSAVDAGYSCGNMVAVGLFMFLFGRQIVKKRGHVAAYAIWYPILIAAGISLISAGSGILLAVGLERSRHDSTIASGSVTFILGFCRTLALSTCGVPLFFVIGKCFLVLSVSQIWRVIIGLFLLFECIGACGSYMFMNSTSDFYPTFVLWSLYVMVALTFAAWLPFMKRLGIEFLWKEDKRKQANKTSSRTFGSVQSLKDGVAVDGQAQSTLGGAKALAKDLSRSLNTTWRMDKAKAQSITAASRMSRVCSLSSNCSMPSDRVCSQVSASKLARVPRCGEISLQSSGVEDGDISDEEAQPKLRDGAYCTKDGAIVDSPLLNCGTLSQQSYVIDDSGKVLVDL
jgi:hypothetical protein